LAVVTPIIYVLFIICFFFKTREVSDRVTKEEKMVSMGIVVSKEYWISTFAGQNVDCVNFFD